MLKPIRSIILAVLVALPISSRASDPKEPDFYLVMKSCKTAVGYLVLSQESLKVLDGTTVVSGCSRMSKAVSCALSFPNGEVGHKGQTVDYAVVMDSPPYLHLSDESGGEYIAIDTAKRAAVIVTRIVGEQHLASKVCQGIFATAFDLSSLQQ